jgi:hypothetical protein
MKIEAANTMTAMTCIDPSRITRTPPTSPARIVGAIQQGNRAEARSFPSRPNTEDSSTEAAGQGLKFAAPVIRILTDPLRGCLIMLTTLIGVISCLPVSGGNGSSQKGNLRFPGQAAAFRPRCIKSVQGCRPLRLQFIQPFLPMTKRDMTRRS